MVASALKLTATESRTRTTVWLAEGKNADEIAEATRHDEHRRNPLKSNDDARAPRR